MESIPTQFHMRKTVLHAAAFSIAFASTSMAQQHARPEPHEPVLPLPIGEQQLRMKGVDLSMRFFRDVQHPFDDFGTRVSPTVLTLESAMALAFKPLDLQLQLGSTADSTLDELRGSVRVSAGKTRVAASFTRSAAEGRYLQLALEIEGW